MAEAVSLSASGAGGEGSETDVWPGATEITGTGLNFLKAGGPAPACPRAESDETKRGEGGEGQQGEPPWGRNPEGGRQQKECRPASGSGEQTPMRTRTLWEEGGAPRTKKPRMCPEMGQVTVPPQTAPREKRGAASRVLQQS